MLILFAPATTAGAVAERRESVSEPKWTPGPYLREADTVYKLDGVPQLLCPDGVNVFWATVRFVANDSDAEGEAVACLFQAAPDLYRELRHLVAILEPLERDGSLNVPGLATLNGARAALAKAEGGGS